MASGGLSLDHPWSFIFGILGNIISFMVFLSPLPTFYRVHKNKTTEGFQSVPYVVTLFSSMLWIYYALIKTNTYLLVSINAIGCLIETIYIVIFLIYAPKKAKIDTAKLVLLLNVGLFSVIVLCTLLLFKGPDRLRTLGWICVSFSISVFVAPLSIIRVVVRTRSVEFMPFSLSLFLTLSAVAWLCFGLFTKDIYVTLPNVVGFVFGVAQIILYIIYKDSKKVSKSLGDEEMVPELALASEKTLNKPNETKTVQKEDNEPCQV